MPILDNVSDIISPPPIKIEFTQISEQPAAEETVEEKITEEGIALTEDYYEPFYQEDIIFYDSDTPTNHDGALYIAPGEHISAADFKYNGYYYDDSGFTYTYYPEAVLPGNGLDISGRHPNKEGYICDADGNLCLSSDDLDPGTVVEVPFGTGVGVVYDKGSGKGNIDLYTSW